MVGTALRRGLTVTAAVIGLEAVYAVLKPTPTLESHDPSAQFGDPDDPTFVVTALGDSSIEAPGVDSPSQIWVSILCQRLARDRHVILRSFAVGGSRAADVLAGQVTPALESEPDLFIVSVGGNDVIKGVSLGEFRRNLDEIVSRLATAGVPIVLSGVGVLGTMPRIYPPLSALMSRRSQRFDRVHWEVAAAHDATVINQRSDEEAVWHHDRSLWAADDFHVSAAGHVRWANTAWKTLGPLMNSPDEPR